MLFLQFLKMALHKQRSSNDMTKKYLKKLAPDHQNTHRARLEELIENEKLLGYVKEEIKAYVNQFKVRKTGSENKNNTYLCSAISRSSRNMRGRSCSQLPVKIASS